MLGVAIGLYVPFSKRPLACLLAFAAGSLISALAIELAYESAQSLHSQGFNAHAAWAFVSAGFAVGAILYYSISLFLEKKGAAVRYVTQFREYALARKKADVSERIKLLATCDLMRHLPAEQIEQILPCIRDRHLKIGRGSGGKGVDWQQRSAHGDLRTSLGGRRRARADRPRHDSRRIGRRRLARSAADGRRLSVRTLSCAD
jgi:hypothetical protein